MGYRSGVSAARSGGVPVAMVQVGPRHGKFYFNSVGHKVYGEPPRGHPDSRSAAPTPHEPQRPAPVSPGGKPPKKTMHELYTKGEVVHVEVAEGKWEKGTIYKTLKNHAVVELHNGGWVHTYPESTKKIDPTSPAAHAPPTASTHAPPPHVPAYAPPPPPPKAKPSTVDLSKIASHVGGSPEFKADVEKAVLKSGLANFLERRPLNLLDEKPLNPGVGGIYIPRLSPDKPNLFIKPGQEKAKDFPPHLQVGPRAETVTHPSVSVRESTLVHELAHHIQLHSEVKNPPGSKYPMGAAPYAMDWTMRAWAHFKEMREKTGYGMPPSDAWVPSLYARTSTSEWFAEAHTAYVYHRETFKQKDPKGFALVQERRKMEGLHD